MWFGLGPMGHIVIAHGGGRAAQAYCGGGGEVAKLAWDGMVWRHLIMTTMTRYQLHHYFIG